MAHLTNARGMTIVVPDEAADSYRAEGWRDAGDPPELSTKTKPKAKKPGTTRTVKESADGVPARADGGEGPAEADPGSVQP